MNKSLDRAVLRPLALGYDAVTPTLFRHIFGNLLDHLQLPGVLLNHGLQGEGMAAARSLGRFTLNTVLGAGGLLDPATEFGLPMDHTDFGVTLARWGVPEGSYQELPVLGPSTMRDTLGRLVEFPFRAVGTLDARLQHFDVIDDTLYYSQDSYLRVRTLYIQRRRAHIRGTDDATEDLNDIFAE